MTAQDAYGNVTPGYTGSVQFTSTDGQAALPGNYTFIAGDNGVHTFSATLKTFGNQTITATDTVTGTIKGTSGAIAVSAGAVTNLAVAAPASATSGTPFNITVTAKDAYGNTIAGYTGTVSFTSSDGAAVLPANYTFVAGDNGSKTFSVTLKASGNQTVTATDTVTGTITGASGAIAVAAASASTLTVTAPATTTAGSVFNVTLTAKDIYGNVATGYRGTIHFTSTDGQASLPANYTFTSGDNGTHTFSVTLKTAGNRTVTATDTVAGTISGTSGTIAVAAASATHLSVSVPANSTAGSSFNVSVTALDAYGNTATGYTGTVAFSSTDGQAVLPGNYAFSSANAGVETVSVTLKTSGNQTITTTDTVTGTITGTSGTVNVAATAAASLSVSAPATATAGASFNVTVTALDAYGNTATGYGGTVHFTSSDGQAVLPANSTLSSGTQTFSVTLKTAGSQTISARDTVAGTITGTSAAISTSNAAATHFTLSAPAAGMAGVPVSVIVTALDAYGNTAADYAGTVHFTSSDSRAVLPADSTLTAGQGTFSVTLRTTGSQTITATDTVTGSITGTSGGIAISTTATQLGVSAPANVTAGAAFNVTITALDQYGNVATGYAGTIHFTSTDGAAVLPADYTFSAGNAGVATLSVTLKTAGTHTIAATDDVTGSITGTSGMISAAAATASRFAVSAPAGTTAGLAFNVTVTAFDAYGNTATAYTGTVRFSSGDGQALLPANYTFLAGDSGSHTFSVTLKTAGNQTVTATDTVAGSITGTSASGSLAVAPAAATQINVAAPAGATAGNAFNATFTALDAYGNTATGYAGTVHFTSSDGGAILPANSTLTNGAGTFSITLKTAGNQTLTATDTVTGSIAGTSGSIAVASGVATHFAIGAAATTTAGSALSVTVTALDASGNVATGYTGTVHFTSTDAAAVLPANYTFGIANAGVATFSTTLRTAGSQSVTATDTVTGTITGTSSAIATSAAAASHFAVSAPASATAGAAFNIAVTALDAYGNTATGYTGTVAFTSSDAQAAPLSNYTFVAGDAGVHVVSLTLKTSGNQTVTATDTVTGSISGTSGSIATSAAIATHFSLSAPSAATAGAAFNITVTALDQFGNTATAYAGAVHFTSSDAAAVLPVDSTLTNGAGNFSITLKTSGNQTITATDTVTGSIAGTSSMIAVGAAAATHLGVAAPVNATAGAAFNVTITALDVYGNVATGYVGTIHLTSTDAAASLPGDYSFGVSNAGVETLSVTLKSAGNFTVTATDTVTGTIAGTSGTIATVAGAATHFSLSGPINAVAGTPFNVTVTALDAYGNAATAYSGTVSFVSTDGAAILPADSTLTSGTGTFTVTLKTSGSQTITATDTVSGSITGTSGTIATAAAAATHLTVTASGNAAVGQAFAITVTARDAYGNTATSYSGTIAFSSTDAAAVLPANSTLTSGVGTFLATLKTVGNQTVTATDTVTGSISGTCSVIATEAAPATHFSVVAPASAYAGTAFTVTVTALDPYGNTDTHYLGTVHLTSTDGSAALPADYTFVAANAGVKTFSVTLLTSGNQTVTATDTVSGSITGSATISTLPAGNTHLVFSAPASATAGTPFNVTVTVKDQFNNTDTGYAGTLHFTSSDTNAVLPADTGLSNGAGTFSVTFDTSGSQTLAASDTVDSSINGSTSAIATFAAPANHFVFASPATATAGTSFNITLAAEDAYGNTDNNYLGTVHFTSSDGAAVLPGDYTFAAANAGVQSFSVRLKTSGSQTVTATDTVTGLITGASGTITTAAATASHFSMTAPANTSAGAAFNITVTALDAFGNTATGYTGTIHFSSSDGQAVLPANYTFISGDAGSKTFSVTLKTAGSQTVAIADSMDGSINGMTGAVSTSPAAASHFTLSAPANATAGAAFNVAVTALDAYGNTATGYAGTVHFTASDVAASLPADGMLTAGVATFSVTLNSAGSQTVTATDTVSGSITGTTAAIATVAGSATHYAVSAGPTATAGVAFNVTVTALDPFGNTATGYSGTVHLSSSDVAAVLPANNTLTNGVGTFSVTLKTAGNQTVTATDVVNNLITGTSGSIANTAAAATQLSVSAPASTTAGSAFSVTITALDPFGNTATSYAGTVHFTSNDGAAALPADSTLTAGAGSFSVSLKTAGSRAITATDTVSGSISGVSGSIAVLPASATHFNVSGPASAAAGAAFNLNITALDAYGNIATGYTGTVHFSSSDGAAALPADYTFAGANAGVGTFSATLKTAGNQTVTATDTITATIAGTSGTINTTASAATHFAVSAPANATAGSSFNVTVTALDTYNNVATAYAGSIQFMSSDGAALLPANSTLAAGSRTFAITLRTAGNQTLSVNDTVSGSIAGISGAIVTTAASATHFSVSAPASVTAGSAFNVTVTALDAYGNTDTSYAGTVHFTSSDGAATLPGDATLASGASTFSVTLKTSGNQTITATDTVTGSIAGTSSGIGVSAAAATHFSVTAPANATASNPFNVTVTALDAYGNRAAGYTGSVHFASTDSAALLPLDYTFGGGNAGAATFTVVLKSGGNQTITATDTVSGSIAGSTGAIDVAASAATHFAITVPGSATAGTAFNVTVTALDAFGNVATGYAGTIRFSSGDGQAVLPADSGLINGTRTFSVTLKTSGNQTITATDTVSGSTNGTSSATNVAPAAANSFTVSTAASATAGAGFNVTVTARDIYGNVATGYSGTLAFTSSDVAAVLPASSTLTSGAGTFSMTLKTAGNQTITATDTVTSSITGTSGAVAIYPAAATHLTVAAPATATAGAPLTVSVTALDPFGNIATAYTGMVHFTSGDAQAALPADSTLSNGRGNFSVTLKTSGNQIVTATDNITGSITGSSGVIATSATAATHFSVAAPAMTAAGSAFNITVTALDPYGNVASGYAGTIRFNSGDAKAVLPVNSTLPGGIGTFSVTLKMAGSQTVTATDTVTGSIAGTSGVISVVASPATHFAVSAPTSATPGSPFNVVVTALDAYGNTATGYAGTVQFASSDSAATLPANSTLTAGAGTFSVTLATAGSQTVSAVDTVNGSLSGTSAAILLGVTATQFVVSAPANARVGTAIAITVQAVDQNGLPQPAYTGTVHFTSSDPTAVLPADTVISGGSGAFTVVFNTAGSQTITVTDKNNTSLSGASRAVNVAANSLVLSGRSFTAYEGTAINSFVLATFNYGNNGLPASSFTASINWGDGSTSPGSVTSTGSGYQVHGNHTYGTRGKYTVTATASATGGPSGQSQQLATVYVPLLPNGTRGTATERYISAAYYDLLGRSVDAPSLAYWANALNGGLSFSQFVQALQSSIEYRMKEVNAAYLQYLHREADPSSLYYWTQFLGAGGTLDQITVVLIGSPEYFQGRSGGNINTFLANAYLDLFHRPIDAAALATLRLAMLAGESPGQVTVYLLATNEYRGNVVQADFQRLLGRHADPAALAMFTQMLAAGWRDEQVILAIMGQSAGSEYYRRVTA